jgi:hypothetical protein
VIDDRHLDELRRNGLTVVPGLVPDAALPAMHEAAAASFPSVDAVLADPGGHHLDPAGLAYRSFPFRHDAINLAAFDEPLLDFVQAAFDGAPPFLMQSLLRASYPLPISADQRLHRDYTDNGLLFPSDEPQFSSLAILVYLTDVGPDNAPLFVVPDGAGRDRPAMPRERTREDDPELYAREVPVLGPAGTGVVYTHAAWHRGSRYAGAGGWRLVMHLGYRPAGIEWLSFSAWGRSFEHPVAARCMELLTPRQRTALGVPAPGHPYWTPATIAGVAARYPGWDMDPYR